MNGPKEVLRRSYEKILMDKIIQAGGHIESAEDIWLNLKYLATATMSYGEEKFFMSLQIKKILAFILDPDYRIEYEVTKTETECTVTASFYWADSDKPAGQGFVKRFVTQIFPNESMTHEERESIFESTVRGLAATRAISDAGIAMHFYADTLEMNDPELSDIENEKKQKDDLPAVPDVPSNNQKKAARASRDSNTAIPKNDSTDKTATSADTNVSPQTNAASDQSDAMDKKAPDMPSADQIAWARNIISDIGQFIGHSLGTILDKGKINGIVWLANNAQGDVSKAANILMSGDSRFDNFR